MRRPFSRLLDAVGLVDPLEAAAYLGVTPRHLRRWLSEGHEPPAIYVRHLELLRRLKLTAEAARSLE